MKWKGRGGGKEKGYENVNMKFFLCPTPNLGPPPPPNPVEKRCVWGIVPVYFHDRGGERYITT
jgi:hypothetical protein